MLDDKDIKEFFHNMTIIKRAMKKQNPLNIDVNTAWQQFATKHKIRKYNWIKIAISIIGIILLSGATLAGIIQFRTFHSSTSKKCNPIFIKNEKIHNIGIKSTKPKTKKDSIDLKPVVFEDEELNSILSNMATFYKVKIIFNDKTAGHIRLYFNWDKKESLLYNINILNGFNRIKITYTDSTICVE